MRNKLYRNDFLLNLIIVCLCVAIPFGMFVLSKDTQKTVVVSYDGQEEKRINLDEDKIYHTHGVVIEVKNGSACVVNSSCPDGLCMKMTAAKNIGDSIICVPNKVSVIITGKKTEGADVVAG